MSTELLGEVVAFDIPSQEVSLQTVKDALVKAGITVDVPELRTATAFNRATKGLKTEKGNEKVIRKRKQEDAKAPLDKFQVNRVLEEDTIDYDYQCTLLLDKETGKVDCTEDHGLAQDLSDGVQEQLQTRTTGDITKIVKGLFRNHADLFPLIPRKGVAYFVPDQFKDFTAKVETFLRELKGYMGRWPVPVGTEEGNQSVQEAVQAGLAEMAAEVGSAVDEWDDKTRKGTMEKKIEKFQQILFKAEAYATYLDAQKDELVKKVEAEKERAKAKMLELMAEEDKPEASDENDEGGSGAEAKNLALAS